MLLPLSVLKTFLPFSGSLSEIESSLPLLGLEVDKIHHKRAPFSGVICAEILSVKPHPTSEKLSLVELDDGKKQETVVCGAKNCKPGMRVPFASVDTGATLLDSKGHPLKMEVATIRGVVSRGMLCTAAELGMAGSAEEILELPPSTPNGTDILPLLWDPVLEISLTPNLGHCLSGLGIARELSAAWNLPLSPFPAPRSLATAPAPVSLHLEAPESCPVYLCQKIDGVQIAPSPFWLQRTLLSAGFKPINNVVDITNYILLKWGQPLHAFDADALHGKNLFIRTLKKGEEFVSLDGEKRVLPIGTLSICDDQGPVAIAGILGGEKSAIHPHTCNVLLEGAFFQPAKIRETAKALKIRTESSLRFEKGTDSSVLPIAFEEAVSLLLSIAGGDAKTSPAAAKIPSPSPLVLSCRIERVNRLLGTHLSFSEVRSVLQRLGFKTQPGAPGSIQVAVPPHRFDIGAEIDLVEEVARIYGLQNIEKKSPLYTTSTLSDDPIYLFEEKVRQAAAAQGLQEILTSDLISPKMADSCLDKEKISLLRAIHAKTEEYSILRPSLLPGMLQVALHNFAQKNKDLSLFEIGRIHFLDDGKVTEIPMLSLLFTGQKAPSHWSQKPPSFDFYDLKGILENLFALLHLPPASVETGHHQSFHPARQADLVLKGARVGSFGELHPRLVKGQRIYFAEIDLALLLPYQIVQHRMEPLPQYPGSERDLTLATSAKRPVKEYFDAIKKLEEPRLEEMTLLDVYYPPESDQKNLTFRFSYRDCAQTLSFEEVEMLHQKLANIIKAL